MSRFSQFFIQRYPQFRQAVLSGNYESAVSLYLMAYQGKRGGKKVYMNEMQEHTAAYDGFHRNGSRREQDLREWVRNDKAFDGFMEFFCAQYGKDGMYRVSNKSAHTIDRRRNRPKFKPKKKKNGTFDACRRSVKKAVIILGERLGGNKKAIEAEVERYIERRFSDVHYFFVEQLRQKIKEERDKLGGSLYMAGQIKHYKLLTRQLEYLNNDTSKDLSVYLLWHAIRYINNRYKGKNIPTNKLTKLLKNSPCILLFLQEKEQRYLLRSLRLQKHFSSLELDNAVSLYYMLYSEYDETSMKIKFPRSYSPPASWIKGRDMIVYKNKAAEFLKAQESRIKELDARLYAASKKILDNTSVSFKILPEEYKVFIDQLPDADMEDRKKCLKTVDRLIGIYTFCSRQRYMTRKEYYEDYFDAITSSKKEQEHGLDMFVLIAKKLPEKKWDKCFFNFNTGRYEEYLSYIDTVQTLYPKEEYVYIKTDYMFPDNEDEKYVDSYGYTLARYTAAGRLCDDLLEGNYVKPITDSDFIPEGLVRW